jgi:hypothetical protein
MKNRKFNQGRTLSFQQLEDRTLMTGNVAANVSLNSLTITGDSNANNIQIEQTSANQFTVIGLGGTTINGKTQQTFTNVTKDLKIDLKGGDDNLLIGSDAGVPPTVTIGRDLSVTLGDGNDYADLNVKVKGNMNVDAGANDDNVLFDYAIVGNPGGLQNATVDMGSGDDTLDAVQLNVAHDFTIKTASSSAGLNLYVDSYTSPNIVGHDFNIQTGDGADNLAVYSTNVGNKLNVTTAGGADFAAIAAINADQIFADMGAGDDYLYLSGSNTARVATFQGNLGNDKVEMDSTAPSTFQSASYSGFETKIGFPVIHPLHINNLPGHVSGDANKTA